MNDSPSKPNEKSFAECVFVFLPSPRHVLFLPCYGFVYQGTGAVNTGAQGIVDILFERRHVSRKGIRLIFRQCGS